MMMVDRLGPAFATRLAFLVAGFGIACWAPLVPDAKLRLGVDDGQLGLLLLCIGIGSVVAMLATGPVTSRWGSRPVIVTGGVGLAFVLPTLAVATTPMMLGALLLLFGAALGSLDVAMNVHAVAVERDARRPMMSGFHALFSLGGFAGAGLMTGLVSIGVPPLIATIGATVLMLAAMALAAPRLRAARPEDAGPLFVAPRGVVLLLALLAAVTFLVEGAMLDWSALLIRARHLLAPAGGGVGYMLFAVAMTAGRLAGDRVTARIGDAATMAAGGVGAVAGFAVLLIVPVPAVALCGFVLIGLGASNVVPVLFRRAGAQTRMPPALAVAAVTTVGYAGVLAGPAAIGFVARGAGLVTAFALLAALMCLVPLTARAACAPIRAWRAAPDGGPAE